MHCHSYQSKYFQCTHSFNKHFSLRSLLIFVINASWKANLVRFFGKNYFYYDAVSLEPQDAPEISAHTVVVDAKELAQAVLCLYEKVRNAY